MQRIPLFFLFHTLNEMQPLQAFDYFNNSFKEHWIVCINATTKFWGHKNKVGDFHYLGSFVILENHKLNRIAEIYKALYKISMISI